nr:hypothetical protein [Gammaproteobacteria bacterium]
MPPGCVLQGCWAQVDKDVLTTALKKKKLPGTSAETLVTAARGRRRYSSCVAPKKAATWESALYVGILMLLLTLRLPTV